MTGDTAATGLFWETVNSERSVTAVLVECAFPNELKDLSAISYHLTPTGLEEELKKLQREDCEVYVVNLKPSYRTETIRQIMELDIPRLNIMEVGRVYEW
jgi:hypothetical protein